MNFFTIIRRNVLRHPLRAGLTALGVGIALFAFCMIRTLIGAWYSGVEASAKNRLVTRNSVSLVFYLPVAYGNTISQVPGVERVGFGNWFGGKFRDEEFRFQQFAVDQNYIDVYPEFIFAPGEKDSWQRDRKGILVGRSVAESFGIKVGDQLQLTGTIFPGPWDFSVSGIFDASNPDKDTRVMFFHWEYLNERNRAEFQRQPDNVGFFVIQLAAGANPAAVSKAIDERFQNSFAETLTETETAFVQGFVSMSSTIIQALDVVSGVVVVIMLLVLANTMLMSFRERYREYSILKAIGFDTPKLSQLIVGEALFLSGLGLLLLALLLLPIILLPTRTLLGDLINFVPVFKISFRTFLLAVALGIGSAIIASIAPLLALRRMLVTDGLRELG